MCKFFASDRILVVRVESLSLKSLLDLIADSSDLLCGGMHLAAGALVVAAVREDAGVPRVLGVSLRHRLGVRHQLRLRQRGGLTVSATRRKGQFKMSLKIVYKF